jgi:hypothetical protein
MAGIDKNSETWITIKSELETLLDSRRQILEKHITTHDESNLLRGEISMAKKILKLADKKLMRTR